MTIDELKNFVNNNRENYSIQLKRKYVDVYNEINKSYNFPTFGQKIYHFLNKGPIGKCEICGKDCKFESLHKGYRKRCSYKCMGKSKYLKSHENRFCVVCGNKFEVYNKHKKTTCSNECLLTLNASKDVNVLRQSSIRKTMNEKYGVDNVFKMSNFEKISKKTKLEKYGDKNYVNVEKCKKTKLEKYGDENYVNVEKCKKTKLEKYGDENFNNRLKAKSTLVDRFGQPYSPNVVISLKKNLKSGRIGFGSKSFISAMKSIYGVENARQSGEILYKSIIARREKYLKYLFKKIENLYVPMFSESDYVGTKNEGIGIKYKFKCKKCESVFEDIISNGKIPRCLSCFPYPLDSGPQSEVLSFIKSILNENVVVNHNDRSAIPPMELDIYIPEKKVAIEFNGIYWHGELRGKDKNYHINKTKRCESVGIRLIHIFENEWIYKQEIVKRRLCHILKLNNDDDKIYARNCNIAIVKSVTANSFLNENHIQGCDKSSIKIGLFYKNELVSIMTFGNKRVALGNVYKNIKRDEYELFRFCSSKTVIGAAGKLFSFFIKTYNPKHIITYADKRYSKTNDAFYEKIGFDFAGVTSPNYWYFYKSNALKLYHRSNFRKNVLKYKLTDYDENLSEWENMQRNGYDRIWDCGHLKYELNFR